MDHQIVICDGGTGHLLKSKGVDALCEGAGLNYDELFAAGSLANALAPQLVREVHAEYIAAGAAVITTNTFGCTRWSLGKIVRADQAVDLAVAGAKLAREATGGAVTVAGSLPPLEESYQVHTPEECTGAANEYRTLAAALAPHVDLFLCETMASAAQARVACEAAAELGGGKPIWAAFTLEDSERAVLRSGEPLTAAVEAIADIPEVNAVLINCCAPAAVTAGLRALKGAPFLKRQGREIRLGAYANGFRTTTSEWLAQEKQGNTSEHILQLPAEEYDNEGVILPEAYLKHARDWVAEGASIVGGCCGVGPEHIALLKGLDGGGEG